MGTKRSHSRYTRLIFLMLHLCPCFSEVLTEESTESTTTHDQNGSESLETTYSALHSAKENADQFTLWQFKKLGHDEDKYGRRRVSDEFSGHHHYPPPHPVPRIVVGGQSATSYPLPMATPRSAGKHSSSKFRLPDFRTIFNKHKFKQRGRGQQQRPGPPRPPHQSYAPSFISYGPIFGPPPVQPQNQGWQSQANQWQSSPTAQPNPWQTQQQPQQNEWQSPIPPDTNQWQSQKQPQSNQWQSQQQPQQNQWQSPIPPETNQWKSQSQQHRPSHSKPSSAPPLPPTAPTYGTPVNRPHYGGGGFPAPSPTQVTPAYGPPKSPTRAYTHPPPTYGPTVRIRTQPQWSPAPPQSPPQWSPTTTRIPPQQNQGPWNPLPPRQHVPNQWTSASTSRTPVQNNYVSPTYVPPTGGYATPSSSYIPPNQNQNQGWNPGSNSVPTSPAPEYGVPVRSYEPPMHFGQPMHNFGPPHSSYGQPPPIIGDPPQDRYAPKDDIYRYPTGESTTGNSYDSPRHRYDTYGEETSLEDIGHTPSTDLYQTPKKPYREPSQRKTNKNRPKPKPKPSQDQDDDNYNYDYTENDYIRPLTPYTPTSPENGQGQGQYGTDARPAPNYDTNYNSPGLSKDLKIVDWMPYSAKNYHQIPSRNTKKKQKAPKYRTLPKTLRDYRPDPEHVNYPKLTYDTLSRRMSEHETQPQFQSKNTNNKSAAETKTEIEDAFHAMLHAHTKQVEQIGKIRDSGFN